MSRLAQHLRDLQVSLPWTRNPRRLVVAFSGGGDSTALLWGLTQLEKPGQLRLYAAHLDHSLDPESRERARMAEESAAALGATVIVRRVDVEAFAQRRALSLEAGARQLRYAFLDQVRLETGSSYVATAHHLDDQIETVVLRLLYGSGLSGLRAIQPRSGPLIRPLLEFSRHDLQQELKAANVPWLEDPTNQSLSSVRNRVRHRLLPHLQHRHPQIGYQLLRLSRAVSRLEHPLERRLTEFLRPRPGPDEASIERCRLAALPEELLPYALAVLQKAAGAPYPIRKAVRQELQRQLRSRKNVGCDCSGGWRLDEQRGRLRLRRESGHTFPLYF